MKSIQYSLIAIGCGVLARAFKDVFVGTFFCISFAIFFLIMAIIVSD